MKRFPFAEFFVVLLAVMSIWSSVAAEQTKVTICHKGKNTITVAEVRRRRALRPRRIPGACDVSPSK